MQILKTPSMSAFLVNESRAKNTALSGDVYAPDWILPDDYNQVADLWIEYIATVYAQDDIVISVRNRHFLGLINQHTTVDTHCILLASGLLSYPLLIQAPIRFTEVDMPNMIDYKKKRLNTIIKDHQLTMPQIDFIGMDLTDTSKRASLMATIAADKNSKKIFIVEGLSYYLTATSWWTLIDEIQQICQSGDIIAFDYWPQPKTDEHQAIYERYRQFYNQYQDTPLTQFFFQRKADIHAHFENAEVVIESVIDAEQRVLGSHQLQNQVLLNDTYVTAILT